MRRLSLPWMSSSSKTKWAVAFNSLLLSLNLSKLEFSQFSSRGCTWSFHRPLQIQAWKNVNEKTNSKLTFKKFNGKLHCGIYFIKYLCYYQEVSEQLQIPSKKQPLYLSFYDFVNSSLSQHCKLRNNGQRSSPLESIRKHIGWALWKLEWLFLTKNYS